MYEHPVGKRQFAKKKRCVDLREQETQLNLYS